MKNTDNLKKSVLSEPSDVKKEYERVIALLRRIRTSQQKSQMDIAERCAVSFTTISAIERGVQVSSSMTLIGYLRALHLDYADLDLNHSSATVKELCILPELKAKIAGLSEDQQWKLLVIVDTIIQLIEARL